MHSSKVCNLLLYDVYTILRKQNFKRGEQPSLSLPRLFITLTIHVRHETDLHLRPVSPEQRFLSTQITHYLDQLGSLWGRHTTVTSLTRASIANVICSIAMGRRLDHKDPFFTSFLESFDKQVGYFWCLMSSIQSIILFLNPPNKINSIFIDTSPFFWKKKKMK